MHTDSSDGSITGDLETERLERLTDIGFDEDWMDEDVDLLNEEALELEDWMFAANADSPQSKN